MIKQGPRGNTIPTLDIGKIVRKRMFETGMNRSRLARKMGRNAGGLSDRIYSSSMQAYLIWELSVALNHNFFADLAAQFDGTAPATTAKNTSTPTELQQLREENAQLRTERDYLRKAIDMITPK